MVSRQNMILCCYIVSFMDLFAVGMLLPLFHRRGRALGASPSTLGIIGSIYGGLQFFSSPYMGKVSDKWGRKHVLMLSLVGCLVGYFTMGVTDTILVFALARLPLGILKHSQTSVKAYLSDITLPEERASVFGMFNAVGSLGFIISPIIGGTVSMQENGFFKVSLMTCSVYLFTLPFVSFIFETKKVKDEKPKSSNDDDNLKIVDKSMIQSESSFTKRRNIEMPTEGTANMMKHCNPSYSKLFSFLKIDSIQNILDILLVRFVMALSMLIYRSNFTTLLDYRHSIDAKTAGYIISYGSIAGAISGLSVGTIYDYVKSDAKMMRYAKFLLAASLFGVTISPNIYTLLLCMAPLSLGSAIMRVNSHNIMLSRIKPEEKGAVMGIGDSLTSIARMLSPAIAGFAHEVSVTGPCWLATSFAVVGIVLNIIFTQYRNTVEFKKKTS